MTIFVLLLLFFQRKYSLQNTKQHEQQRIKNEVPAHSSKGSAECWVPLLGQLVEAKWSHYICIHVCMCACMYCPLPCSCVCIYACMYVQLSSLPRSKQSTLSIFLHNKYNHSSCVVPTKASFTEVHITNVLLSG